MVQLPIITLLVTLLLGVHGDYAAQWCSDAELARGCNVYTFGGSCICPICTDGLVDQPKFDSSAQSTQLKCQYMAFDYAGGASYAWGVNGAGCYTYAGVVTEKPSSGFGEWVTCSMPKGYRSLAAAEAFVTQDTASTVENYAIWGLAAVGFGAIVYAAATIVQKKTQNEFQELV